MHMYNYNDTDMYSTTYTHLRFVIYTGQFWRHKTILMYFYTYNTARYEVNYGCELANEIG